MSLALEHRNAEEAKRKREKEMAKVLKDNGIEDDGEHSKRCPPLSFESSNTMYYDCFLLEEIFGQTVRAKNDPRKCSRFGWSRSAPLVPLSPQIFSPPRDVDNN